MRDVFRLGMNLCIITLAAGALLTAVYSVAEPRIEEQARATVLEAVGAVLPGMDVDPATGTLYVADGESGGTDTLYTLDPSTGALTASELTATTW